MGLSYSTETDSNNDPPSGIVKSYCQSVVFVKFYGQTSKGGQNTDEKVEKTIGGSNTDLGKLIKKLDAEIRAAPSPSEFEVTDKFRDILRDISVFRHRELENDTCEKCYARLLENAKNFQTIYRERNALSEVLHSDHDTYWGTRQQLLFGKVIVDWIDRCDQKPKHEELTDPIFGVLLNPTGGRVGPGDTGWFHNTLFDDYGAFAYHSAVHDGFGYLKTNHNTGPGYDYLDEGWLSDSNPLAGQFCGISFWKEHLSSVCPEAHLDQFYKT